MAVPDRRKRADAMHFLHHRAEAFSVKPRTIDELPAAGCADSIKIGQLIAGLTSVLCIDSGAGTLEAKAGHYSKLRATRQHAAHSSI